MEHTKTEDRLTGRSGLLVLVFFIFVFFYFTHPIRVGDFWWHLNTGRWIVQNMALPTQDPFTLTGAQADQGATLALRGYWLSEVLYYLIYKAWGFNGLIVLKTSLFTAIFAALYFILRKRGLGPLAAVAVMAPIVPLMREFEEVRPQVFSFLMALLLYRSLEGMLNELRSTGRASRLALATAPALMLLWPNLHRGFVMGYALMGVYALLETARYVLKKDGLGRAAYPRFMAWLSASAVCSFINPVSYNALYLNLREMAVNPVTQTIDEYLSPWGYAAFVNDPGLLYALAAFAGATLIVMAINIRRLRAADAILYAGLLIAGLWAFRFCAFFLLLSPAISSAYLAPAISRLNPRRYAMAAAAAVLVFMAVVSYRSWGYSAVTQGPVEKAFLPEKAAAFIDAYNLPPPLFNPYEWGGYLSFRLYPRYKVFIDARALHLEVHRLYRAAKAGRQAKEALERFGINTVVFYPVFPLNGRVPGIVQYLLDDEGWVMPYLDPVSVVFVRKEAAPNIPVIGKQMLKDRLARYKAEAG